MKYNRLSVFPSTLASPPAGPSLPRLPTFRFFCHGNDCPGRFKHHFFQSISSTLPRLPVVQLIFLSLINGAPDDRSKHKSPLTSIQNHEKKNIYTAFFPSELRGKHRIKSINIPFTPLYSIMPCTAKKSLPCTPFHLTCSHPPFRFPKTLFSCLKYTH